MQCVTRSIPDARRRSRIDDTLAEIHDRGIIHRDVNPANILLNPDPGELIIALTASATTEIIAACADSGMDHFLSAPLRLDAIRNLLQPLQHRR